MDIIIGLLFVVVAAVLGGTFAKLLKFSSLAGYIVAGVVVGAILPENLKTVSGFAQIGTILLLFSIGLELSLDKLAKFFKVAIFGGLIQIVLVTVVVDLISQFFGVSPLASLVLALGFSLSSTAVCVKMLNDKGETDTIHGGVMVAWLLVQDLAVIPIMVILPVLSNGFGNNIFGTVAILLTKAVIVVVGTLLLGKMVVPKVIHFVAETNSRELLLLTSVGLALGTAVISSYFGISAALGAFLAGIVISESQEHHAIFAETRPLRDLFVALFFVTLGFLVNPSIIVSELPLILTMTLILVLVKIVVVFFVSYLFGYKGRTGIATSFGLAQVGEFAFVIFSSALTLKLIGLPEASIGISVTLLTLVVAPLLFSSVVPFWRKMRDITSSTGLSKLFASGEKREESMESLSNHIIICGYGRVGKWVGKALTDFQIPFIVVEYNQTIVQDLKKDGTPVLYGDPTEPEVLEAVFIRGAKAVVLAIPDRVAQETLIAYIQTVAPDVKIISRVHLDSDWEKLKTLRVNKIVQPEFEAAMEIVRSILRSTGKNRDEISGSIKSLRVSHSR